MGGSTVKMMKKRQMGKLADSCQGNGVHNISPFFVVPLYMYIYHLLTKVCVFVVFAVLQVAGVWAYFYPKHWACYEQLRSKMKVLKIVSIKLESNKHVTISHVLYFFGSCLYKTKSGLRVDRIMNNHYVYAREFCTGFQKKLLEFNR